MNELRKHYFLDRWVIVSKDRASRPHNLEVREVNIRQKTCPLDRETLDMPIVDKIGEPWTVASILNKYPALTTDVPLDVEDGFFETKGAYGSHEVIIDHYLHKNLEDFSDEHITNLIEIYARRTKYHMGNDKIQYVSVFRNSGADAGASIAHPHSQLVALPVVPRQIYRERGKLDEYFKMHGENAFDTIYREEKNGPRMLFETLNFFVIAPFASIFQGETWIISKQNVRTLFELSKEQKQDLALTLKKTIKGIQKVFPGVSYNFAVHQAPRGRDFRLHLEIMPRLNKFAGFELSNDMYMNTLPPENYAQEFREAIK
ncbi:MAG: galactose-1-phosphate uridylyltransferase [Candidatus Altiarchaeota archaeon]|nr:galactose-1-phosphate uridylyltransferase [Candidatus Altiarchaeota archaeon]